MNIMILYAELFIWKWICFIYLFEINLLTFAEIKEFFRHVSSEELSQAKV